MFKGTSKTRILMISFDDKNIGPGSDVGARDVRKGVIYDVPDPSKEKQLPHLPLGLSRDKLKKLTAIISLFMRKIKQLSLYVLKGTLEVLEVFGRQINSRLNGRFLNFLSSQ